MPSTTVTMTVDGRPFELNVQNWRAEGRYALDNPCSEVESVPTETVQRDLFGGPPLPAPATAGVCAGGCERELPDSELSDTPTGRMCERCIEDLYAKCADCDKLLRYDEWGECDDLRVGPDDKHRCVDCDATAFSICCRCGCRTPRDGDVRTHPVDPSREYCASCWGSRWFTCPGCDEVTTQRSAYSSPGGSTLLCEDCFEASYFRCPCCGNSHPRADALGWDGDPYCENCYGRADVWKVQPWSGHAITFDRIGSERCFGVELETSRSHNHTELHGKTEWGCVYECSTPGRELISPILQGDEGLAEIREICSYASDHDWRIDSSCGLHVHIDARDLSSDQALQIAYAYRRSYPLWKKFVGRRRADNSMCGSPQYNAADIKDIEHIEDFVESRDRFEFVNWRSYLRHSSIEIRMYRGSLRGREICNWVALHARFVDAVKDMTFDEIDVAIGAITRKNWVGLVNLIGDPDLLDYWRRKAHEHGTDLPALWNGETDVTEVTEVPRGLAGLGYTFNPDLRAWIPEGHCGDVHCNSCPGEIIYD